VTYVFGWIIRTDWDIERISEIYGRKRKRTEALTIDTEAGMQ